MHKVTILVFDGVADGPFGITLDVLGAALRIQRALPGAGRTLRLTTRVLSMDGRPVRTAAGRSLQVDGSIERRIWTRDDILVLPGLGMASESEIEATLARAEVAQGLRVVASAAGREALVAASCSATFLLGAAGLLDGREATTTWWLSPGFTRRFPRALVRTDRMVVMAGNVLTAGSALAHADLMLAIVARLGGASLAHTVARYLLLDERTSQARYMISAHIHNADPVIRALEGFVGKNLTRQLSVSELARATATSPRTLARRVKDALGTTPLHLVQRMRVERAVHLLETTRHSVDEVAARVGYADPAAFRRVLRRETGHSPRTLRLAALR